MTVNPVDRSKKPMPAKDQAAYMRNYRKARKADDATQIEPARLKDKRIAELEADLAHLKRALAAARAAQPLVTNAISEGSGPIGRGTFNSRPFTPAPKQHR